MLLKKNKTRNPLKHPEQRVGVFIDVQNLYYSAKIYMVGKLILVILLKKLWLVEN